MWYNYRAKVMIIIDDSTQRAFIGGIVLNTRYSVWSFLPVLFVLCAAGRAHSAVHLVKPDGTGDYVTIQDAITSSVSGDTIQLDDGTFTGPGNKDLDPGGRNLVFQPAPGASPVIDCEDSGRAFYIHGGEDASLLITGLRIINGYVPDGPMSKGGAIIVENASPTLKENVFAHNEAWSGGAVYFDNSSSLVLRNRFDDNGCNLCSFSSAIYAAVSALTIYDNNFRCSMSQRAIFAYGCTLSIENNTFLDYSYVDAMSHINADSCDVILTGNYFEGRNGGVWLYRSTGIVRANHFFDLYKMVWGGGVYCEDSDVDVLFNYFDDAADGAVDYYYGSTGNIKRNVIARTPVRPMDYSARSIQVTGSQADISANTFYENGVSDYPDNFRASDVQMNNSSVTVSACIFVNSIRVDLSVQCDTPHPAPAAVSQGTYGSNWHWGNPTSSFYIFCGSIVSLEVSPILCDPDNGNFFLTGGLPDDTTLVGALPPGCSTSDVLLTSVPPDDSLGMSSFTNGRVLTGFSFQNLSNFPAPVNYRLLVSGAARLDDNGDMASLAGSTPVLDPGETWVPPAARLFLGEPLTAGVVTVKYVTAYAPALAIPDTTTTTMDVYDDVTGPKPGRGLSGYALKQNFPNPANPVTTIAFSLAAPARVTLKLYDVQGRLVKTLADAPYTEGWHTVEWNGTNARNLPAASGIYFYRLQVGTFSETKKLVLLK